MIHFSFEDALLLKNKKNLEYYFGKEKLKILNRYNVKRNLKDDFYSDKISPVFEENLYNDYISKMNKGQRIIFIVPYPVMGNIETPVNVPETNYFNNSNFGVLIAKVSRDAFNILNKYTKRIDSYYDNSRNYQIYLFEKP